MAADKFHLTKKGDEWRLEKAKSNRPIVRASTKKEAMQKMMKYMANRDGSVRIHKEDGKIQEERTYHKK